MQFSSTKILRVLSMCVCLCSNMAYVRLCVWVEVSECLGRFLCASSLLSLDKRDDLWDLTEMTFASKSTDVTKQTQKSTSVAVADSSTSEDNNCNKHMQQWPFFLVGIENVAFAFVCVCVCVCVHICAPIHFHKKICFMFKFLIKVCYMQPPIALWTEPHRVVQADEDGFCGESPLTNRCDYLCQIVCR